MLDDSRSDEILPDQDPHDVDSAPEQAREVGRSPFEPPRDGSEERPLQQTEPEAGEYAPHPEKSALQPQEDFFTQLNAVPDDDTGSVEPPFVVTERDFGLDDEPKTPSKAATFVAGAVVVLAVVGILMTAASIKLFAERAEMSAALKQSTDRLAMLYAGPEATDTSKRRIAWLRNSIEEGDFAQARKAIQSLGTPAIERPSLFDRPDATDSADAAGDDDRQRRLPEPAEDTALPLKAQAFFEQHPKLWEAFFGFTITIKRMEQAEVPVGELMQLRSEMVKAAEFGQAQKIESLLNQARKQIEGQQPNQLPQALQAKLQEFGQAIQQAQQQRRDPRAAVALAQQSERAAQQGDMQRAERLMDQAIVAVKNAPRLQMPRAPHGGQEGGPGQRPMPQMGPEIGLIKFVADLATRVMKTEERDLTQIWESINIAAGAIREKNADQIREILDEAKESFHEIGDRRRQMSAAIQQAQAKVREARGGPTASDPRSAEPSEEQQRERQQLVLDRVTNILTQVRSMPREDFEANRAEIAQAILQAMTASPQASIEEQLRDLSPEERARRKMELAGRMYLQLRQDSDVDTTELDEKFTKVRVLLTEHEYERAEELADEGIAMMQKMAQGIAPADGGIEDAGGYGPQLQLDTLTPGLNLRPDAGKPRVPATVAPSDPARVSDDINEGDEQ